jgi:D-beta-D-heptose 7-phosphate kinase/D-beta-D-heptose 1-phosphate adenosyltransferase
VSGREVVEENGGQVVLADMVEGRSTTSAIEKILKVYGKQGV